MTKTPLSLPRTLPDPAAGSSLFRTFGHRLEPWMLGVAIVLALVLSAITPGFLSRINVITIIEQSVVIGTVSVGMTLVIIGGGIDLSVGAVAGLSGIVLGLALKHVALPLAIMAGLLTGAGIGLLSGLLVGLAGLAPVLVTLGVMVLGRSLAGILSGETAITDLPEGLRIVVDARIAGVPVNVILLLVLYGATWAFLTQSKGGRTLYAVGSNRAGARAAGLRTTLYTILPYLLSGALAAVAAIFATGRLMAADPSMGLGLELNALAAVAIGGTSLTGGRGSIVGTLIGVLIVVMLRNGLGLAGISSLWQGIGVGTIIILSPLVERILGWRAGR